MKKNIKKVLILSLLFINPLSLYFTNNNLLANSIQQEECTICLSNIDQDSDHVTLGCLHKFHSACINNWISDGIHSIYSHQASCPNCRTPIGNLSQEGYSPEANIQEEIHNQVSEPALPDNPDRTIPEARVTLNAPQVIPQVTRNPNRRTTNQLVPQVQNQVTSNVAREFRIQRRRPTLNSTNSHNARSANHNNPHDINRTNNRNRTRTSGEESRRKEAEKKLKKKLKKKILKLKKIFLIKAKNKFRSKTNKNSLIKKYVQRHIKKAKTTLIR